MDFIQNVLSKIDHNSFNIHRLKDKQFMNNQVDSDSYTRRNFLSSTLKTSAAIFTAGLLPRLSAKGTGKI